MISNLLLSSSAVLFPLITFPYVTRTLSSDGLGSYFFYDAFTQYLILFSAVGIPFYGIREISKLKIDEPSRSKLVVELLTIQVSLALLFSIILVGAYLLIPGLNGDFKMIKISCLNLIGSSFLMEWFYQGIEKFTYITVRSLIIRSLCVLGIICLVKHAGDNDIYYLLLTLAVIANALLNFIYYLKNYHHPYTGQLELKRHVKSLLILFSINVSVSVYAVIDTIILKFLTSNVDVSYYNVPFKLVKIYWTLMNAVGLVLIPRIAAYFSKNDMQSVRSALEKSLNVVLLLGLPFSFFCIMFAGDIINVVAGPKYVLAVPALRLLSFIPFIIAVCNVFGAQFLLPAGKEKKILHATLVGLAISLALNFLLIPHFRFMGTAIASVTAETAVCVYIVAAAVKEINIILDYRLIVQIIISAVATAIIRYGFLPAWNGIPILFVAGITYCLSFLALQLFWFKNAFIYSLVNFKHL
ncbi:flippase [Mucilaginibacter corticis]|nr:flippase [Mucilaginibacter corticis]